MNQQNKINLWHLFSLKTCTNLWFTNKIILKNSLAKKTFSKKQNHRDLLYTSKNNRTIVYSYKPE